jgi:cell division protease FtsH
MIGNYGMGNKLETFYNDNVDNERNPFLGRNFGSGDKYSDKIKEIFDKESLELVNDAYQEAKLILLANKSNMQVIINELMEKNTLYGKDVNQLISK